MTIMPVNPGLEELYKQYTQEPDSSAQQIQDIQSINPYQKDIPTINPSENPQDPGVLIPDTFSRDDTSSAKDFSDWFLSMKDGFDSYTKDAQQKIDQMLQQIQAIKDKEGTNYDFYEQYLKTGELAFLEAYYQNKLAQENEASARAWEEQMSNTAFSRLIADIKRSGYNPWLALQNGFGQASYGGSSAAAVSGISGSGQMTTKRGQDVSRDNNRSTNATRFATIFISAMVKIFTSFMQAGASITSSVLGN